MALGGGDQRLRDVAATRDLGEDTTGDLVPPVGGLAAKTGRRLEEPLLATAPEGVGVGRQHFLGTRDIARQQLPVMLADTNLRQPLLVPEGHQIALVGVQRMHLRMRGENHRVGQIGGTQGRMLRLGESEVGEPVVDQIDPGAATSQALAIKGQLIRVGDHRRQTMRFEQLAEEFEFGRQILLAGPCVNNRDAHQRPLTRL